MMYWQTKALPKAMDGNPQPAPSSTTVFDNGGANKSSAFSNAYLVRMIAAGQSANPASSVHEGRREAKICKSIFRDANNYLRILPVASDSGDVEVPSGLDTPSLTTGNSRMETDILRSADGDFFRKFSS